MVREGAIEENLGSFKNVVPFQSIPVNTFLVSHFFQPKINRNA